MKHTKKLLSKACMGLGLLCAAGTAVTGCSSMQNVDWARVAQGAAKTAQAATVTDAQLAQAVAQSVAKMDAEGNVAPASSAYAKRLNRLVGGIKEADGIPINFKVYQTKEVNAFACPDGSVRVYAGLMDLMSDEELVGIIGHELGHVVMRHSLNAFRNQLLTSAARDGIASTGGLIGTLSDTALGQLGEAYVTSKFSRAQENEADDCAYEFLVASKINPWVMVMAFEKFAQLEQESGAEQSTYISKMFSSHPDTQARIAHISARCTSDNFTRPAK